VSTLNRNGVGLRVAGRAYPYRQLALWSIAAALPLVMAGAGLAALMMAGTPLGPLDLPIPQPAPVGP
jgi:hypothetical protein